MLVSIAFLLYFLQNFNEAVEKFNKRRIRAIEACCKKYKVKKEGFYLVKISVL